MIFMSIFSFPAVGGGRLVRPPNVPRVLPIRQATWTR